MSAIARIFAFLLILLGGGCTLLFLFEGIPFSFAEGGGFGGIFLSWIILGVVPLYVGISLLKGASGSGRASFADPRPRRFDPPNADFAENDEPEQRIEDEKK